LAYFYRHVAWWFKSPSSSLVANESFGCFFNVAIHRRFAAEALLAHHPFASRCFLLHWLAVLRSGYFVINFVA
jgi:hypothetical protein